ncbi:DNA polymerase III subunit delta [Sporosarcina sp. ACRSM]|uniref:DNA polymerase III subunit delta n=1 Tax=Sporosarcina sp. ACRSM TaxID=2918216 RepID=UPI001EF3DEB7|nr:DNA polymerase III subunit delta [Sporosarcina sp. ACRSM]MCG7336436.1 DNA polymerase III subunit delta [Sporosarcina sp. ACRSM]
MANAIWKKIAAGQIDPVYLLTGLEQHIFDTTVNRLKKAMPDLDEASLIRFDLEETPVEAVIEEADTLPFLQERKLIIAGNANFLKAQDKSREKVTHNLAMLETWLANPSPTAVVVFMAPYEKLDARKRITKIMKEQATVIEAERLQGKDLIAWIQQEASSIGTYISADDAQLLVDMAGDQLLTLATEINKMGTYLNGEGEITASVIELLVPRTPEMDVFRLTDAYVAGRVPDTISIYHDLLRNGEEPIMLTSLIASQIRLMIHVGTLRKKGYHQQQIAKTLGVHPYRVKLMMENRQIPQAERLLVILDKLAEIDYKLKSTGGKRERVLELFFMEPLRK